MAKKLDLDIPRLCQAIYTARQELQTFREERTDAVRQYVGRHYSANGTDEKVPINLLSQYVSVVGRNLISNNPRVKIDVWQRSHKPTVKAMETWINRQIKKIKLVDTLQRAVLDSLFSIGIVKVALATPGDAVMSAWTLDAGEPIAEVVDLDDFVFDIKHARNMHNFSFMGHRYRWPRKLVEDWKVLSKARKDVETSDDSATNEHGDERISAIGRGTSSDSEEYEEMVDLWEIYLPRHRMVVTLSEEQMTGPVVEEDGKPLRVQPWIGPYCGPYHILGQMTVPGNAMPKAPIMDLIDLHMSYNHLWRKLINQAQRQKSLGIYQLGNDEQAERIRKAGDGEMVGVENPQAVSELNMGGPFDRNIVLGDQLYQIFSRQSGNLDMLGGLGPQSKTATQDKLLNEAASRAIVDMQERTTNWVAQVEEALCWFWHKDPFKEMKAKFQVQGMPEIETPTPVSVEQRRQIPFEDMDIRLDPYSLKFKSPEDRMMALNNLMTQVIIPLSPQLAQQGIFPDMNAYLNMVAEFTDMPGMKDLITVQEPPEIESTSSGEGGGMPGNTTRNYVRENMPGRTQQGDSMNLRNAMMGVNPGGNPNATKNGSPSRNGV